MITGGAGFIGLRLARRLLELGHLHGPAGRLEPIEQMILFDTAGPAAGSAPSDPRVEVVAGDVSDRDTVYGMTKALGELLVNEYSRKGFVDGRSARLSTVIVRPGKPNRAASGFASSVIREPLASVDYALPVARETALSVIGYRTAVDGLAALYSVEPGRLGADRALNLPSLSITVDEMIAGLERAGAGRSLGKIAIKIDPFIAPIVAGWPCRVDAARARALGLPEDHDIDTIVRSYIEDYL